jgi:Sec-independent protein secretion pathway component TatC
LMSQQSVLLNRTKWMKIHRFHHYFPYLTIYLALTPAVIGPQRPAQTCVSHLPVILFFIAAFMLGSWSLNPCRSDMSKMKWVRQSKS